MLIVDIRKSQVEVQSFSCPIYGAPGAIRTHNLLIVDGQEPDEAVLREAFEETGLVELLLVSIW